MGLHMALNVDRKTDVEVVGFDVSESNCTNIRPPAELLLPAWMNCTGPAM